MHPIKRNTKIPSWEKHNAISLIVKVLFLLVFVQKILINDAGLLIRSIIKNLIQDTYRQEE
jgi:hypothetical protein